VADLSLIAVDFPAFKDGRGFSTATLLRSRYGFRGDLRAIGDVVLDLLFYLRRVGFSSFHLRADQDRAAAAAALRSFSDVYQASVDQPLPYFRRRSASGGQRVTDRIASALATLRAAAEVAPAAFSTSFGAEDMVVLDLIRRNDLAIDVFTLDTGRLPEETYALMQRVEERYGKCVATYFPAARAVQELVAANGINGFYASVDNRKACCAIRKLEPLGRALAGKRAWVTGLRAQQSVTRAALAFRETDAERGLEKFNPLADWTEADVWAYIRADDVPYNALHDRFYPSIGCAPCTRAITPGEDLRAGRWWWELPEHKECGLHVQDGRVARFKTIAVKEIA
jgi:phosphoadenosine phosphosulfate reductase